MSFAAIIAAFAQVEALFGPYVPLGLAALAALKSGGVKGLLAYMESLLVTPPPGPVPPQAELQSAITSLRDAHA